ncbi:hypothetical protein K0M31_018384 [Melipona bicolor]|uniref:Uncharacterized protein n=2 Tax=Meliponini TaxID=83319 RepID=A0AA40G487_9HYME|nr:hypothetical protein K0M31_018384 [Melipona bicolor]
MEDQIDWYKHSVFYRQDESECNECRTFSVNFQNPIANLSVHQPKIQGESLSIDQTEHRPIRPSGDANSLPFEGPVILHGRVSMLVDDTNRVPLRQLAIFDAEYPSEAAVAPTATHLANWRPDNKLQTVAHVHARAVVYIRRKLPSVLVQPV